MLMSRARYQRFVLVGVVKTFFRPETFEQKTTLGNIVSPMKFSIRKFRDRVLYARRTVLSAILCFIPSRKHNRGAFVQSERTSITEYFRYE